MNVSAAKNTEPGMTIPVLLGKVEEVYQRRNGSTDKGLWAVQKVKLSEGKDWIFIDFWNKPELSDYKGHQIKITCDRGIEVKENNWTDKNGNAKTGLAFSAGKGAVITSPGFGDEGDAPQQTAQAQPPPHIPPPAHQGISPNEPFVKRQINRFANLYLQCMIAADYISDVRVDMGRTPLSDAHYQATCAALFIKSDREGLADHIAVGKFNKAEPQQEPAPAPAPAPPPPPQPPPAFVPPQAPRTPANPGYGDHRDQGHAFPPNDGIDDDVPF